MRTNKKILQTKRAQKVVRLFYRFENHYVKGFLTWIERKFEDGFLLFDNLSNKVECDRVMISQKRMNVIKKWF